MVEISNLLTITTMKKFRTVAVALLRGVIALLCGLWTLIGVLATDDLFAVFTVLFMGAAAIVVLDDLIRDLTTKHPQS